MGLEFLDDLPKKQRAGAINLVSLLDDLTPESLAEADPQDFYPRDRHFLDRLRWLANVDPQILTRVRLVREKLLAIHRKTTDDPVPLVQRDADTITETAWTSFYDTGLYIPSLTFSTLDLSCGFIGGDFNCKDVTVNGNIDFRGLVVTGEYDHEGLKVKGFKRTTGLSVLGKDEPISLDVDDIDIVSRSLPPPAKVPAEAKQALSATQPKTAAKPPAKPRQSLRPQAQAQGKKPKQSLRPAANAKPAQKSAEKPTPATKISRRPKAEATASTPDTSNVDHDWEGIGEH
jgi:hypothetical protein